MEKGTKIFGVVTRRSQQVQASWKWLGTIKQDGREIRLTSSPREGLSLRGWKSLGGTSFPIAGQEITIERRDLHVLLKAVQMAINEASDKTPA